MKPSKTKTVCQVCEDNYSSENYELGMCCGKPLIIVENKDYKEQKEQHDRFIARALKEANNLGW